MYSLYDWTKEDVGQEYSKHKRRFCILHWEEIITKIHLLCIYRLCPCSSQRRHSVEQVYLGNNHYKSQPMYALRASVAEGRWGRKGIFCLLISSVADPVRSSDPDPDPRNRF